jgi:hypothetical protein
MNWALVAWTAVGWVISGGLLYLTYKFGKDQANEIGDGRGTWRIWKNGALAIGLAFAMMVFGIGGDPDQMKPSYHDAGSLTARDWSRMLGILIAFVCAYSLGFFDGRRAGRRR